MGQKYFYTYNMPNQIKALQHDDLGLADSLCHYTTGKEIPGHKYISREWKNGGWVYTYADKDAPVNRRENREGHAVNVGTEHDIDVYQNREKKKEIKEKWFEKDETEFNKEKDKLSNRLDQLSDYYNKAASEQYAFNQKYLNKNISGKNYSRGTLDEIRKLKQELRNLKAEDYTEFMKKISDIEYEYKLDRYLATHTEEEIEKMLGIKK